MIAFTKRISMANLANQANEEYRQKLRHRNVSNPTGEAGENSLQPNPPQQPNSPAQIKEGSETGDTGCIGDLETDTVNSSQQPQQTQPQPQPQLAKIIPVVNMASFEDGDMDDKLNLLMVAMNTINTNFHIKFENLEKKLTDDGGVFSRLSVLEGNYDELLARIDDAEGNIAIATDNQTKISQLEGQVANMVDEIAVLKGLIQVQDANWRENNKKIVDLTARSMANNVIISGLTGEDAKEDCKAKVLEFLRGKLLMTVEDNEIKVAHRLGGPPKSDKPRLMVIRCGLGLRNRIFTFTKNLKGITNAQGDYYMVRPQLPEPLHSEKMDREDQLRSIKKANEAIPEDQKERRTAVSIKNRVLYVNKIPQKQHIKAPTVQEMFNISKNDQKKLEDIKFSSTEAIVDKASSFRGHALRVTNSTEIRLAYKKLRLLYPESNHVVMAYSVKTYVGFDDHGEFGAGKRLQRIITGQGYKNVAVFVTREYGGSHIGPRRFLHMEKVAKDALSSI